MERRIMGYFYWFLKLSLVASAIFFGVHIYEQIGWWYVAILVQILWTISYFDKKLLRIKKQKLTKSFSVLKELRSGQVISIELKNGRLFSNVMFNSFDEFQITFAKKLVREQILQGENNMRQLKFNKIKSIKSVDAPQNSV